MCNYIVQLLTIYIMSLFNIQNLVTEPLLLAECVVIFLRFQYC